jgi:hypothetical protein
MATENGGTVPSPQAFVGDVAQAQPSPRRDIERADLGAIQRNRPGDEPPLAGQHLGQVFLAVAVDPGDAEDFARPDLERDGAQRTFSGLG